MAVPTVNLQTKTIPAKYSFLENLQVGLNVVAIGAWLGGGLVYAFSIGRRRGPILLLSTYGGFAIATVVSRLSILPSKTLTNLAKNDFFLLGVFVVATLLAFVALLKVIRIHTRGPFTKNGILLMGILEMGAFLSAIGSFLPSDFQKQITGFASVLFTAPWTLALWLIVPLVVFLVSEHNQRAILDNV